MMSVDIKLVKNICLKNWSEFCSAENAIARQPKRVVSQCLKSDTDLPVLTTLKILELTHLLRGKNLTPQDLTRLDEVAGSLPVLKRQVFQTRARIKRREVETQAAKDKLGCQKRDYRSKLPPIRDQDSMGWCYGFVTADILSFKSRQNISAMDVSIAYYKDPGITSFIERTYPRYNNSLLKRQSGPSSQLNNGSSHVLMSGLIGKSACLEKDFPSEDFRNSEWYGNLKQVLQRVELSTIGAKFNPDGSIHRITEGELASSVHTLAPNMSAEDAVKVVQAAEQTKIMALLKEETCKNKVPINIKEVHIVENLNHSMISNVQEQLNSNNIISITYNLKILRNPSHKTELNNRSGHISSVVGQRWNSKKNQCEFLLRNSWGRQCASYSVSYDCEPDGHVWIPAHILSSATVEVSYAK